MQALMRYDYYAYSATARMHSLHVLMPASPGQTVLVFSKASSNFPSIVSSGVLSPG